MISIELPELKAKNARIQDELKPKSNYLAQNFKEK